VRFFFKAHSALAKLPWLMVGLASVSMSSDTYVACLLR
jgi:hypothetical protein